jgi:type III secretion protein K
MDRAPVLPELIHRFNFLPAPDADASWLPHDWGAEHQASLDTSAHVQDLLSHWLLARHGLQQSFCFDFSAPERRVALLPRAAFQKLASHLALVLCRSVLRTAIDKQSVDRLIQTLGIEAYEFALLRAPDMRVTKPAMKLAADPSQLAQHLLFEGGRHLLAVFEPSAFAVRGRVALKLPREVSASALLVFDKQERAMAQEVITACIIPEVLPQWDWLF